MCCQEVYWQLDILVTDTPGAVGRKSIVKSTVFKVRAHIRGLFSLREPLALPSHPSEGVG